MRVQNRKNKRQDKKECREPAGEFRQHIGCLRAKDIFRNTAAECRAQTLTFRPLHQNDQDHEQRDNHVGREEKVNQNGHRDVQYG